MTGGNWAPTAESATRVRSESRRRLLIGLGGLLLMLLLVLLAGYLTGEARQQAEVAKAQAEAVGVDNPGNSAPPSPSPNEPLADVPLTVENKDVPGTGTVPVMPAGDGGVIVPDLQPDPELKASQRQR